jgi:hypothetical protein
MCGEWFLFGVCIGNRVFGVETVERGSGTLNEWTHRPRSDSARWLKKMSPPWGSIGGTKSKQRITRLI